jgi:uridine monophosphate synthetase
MDFMQILESRSKDAGTSLCVGLDPRIPAQSADPYRALVDATAALIEATAPYALCFKPNLAFYEAFGAEGFRALETTVLSIPEGIPVILDAKRGDIGPTAEAYATALVGRPFVAGRPVAVTLSPYMGKDSVDPFLAYPDAGVFVLCRTSNPDAPRFQNRIVSGEGELYLSVARECPTWSSRVGLVVAGNSPASLRAVRQAAPEGWFLAPGIGTQGGDASEALAAGAREDGYGVIVMAARSVAGAADPAKAARDLRDSIEAAREAVLARKAAAAGSKVSGASTAAVAAPPASSGESARQAEEDRGLKEEFFRALIGTGGFRLGDFVLKSGKRSPFYIDMRRLVSDPGAMVLAGKAYAAAVRGCDYARVAGIPAAALPLATVACLELGKPMIWPRMPAKEHGTGNRIEGDFAAGERILLLDDLITTGLSKLEALAILRGEGLVVEDLVVLLERGAAGRADMEANGVRLRAFAHVRELFAVCERMGLVDAARRAELESFVDSE